MARQDSRVRVIDSTLRGEADPLPHSIYAIVYTPSWLRLKFKFKWTDTEQVVRTLETMKEYFVAAPFEERPIRAQRCLYSLRTLKLFSYNTIGLPRYSQYSRDLLSTRLKDLTSYLQDNPVVAWDWVVSWSECRAMAEAFPQEYVRLYRRLRSQWSTKRQPKPELLYLLNIMETVAKEKEIDMEHKWK